MAEEIRHIDSLEKIKNKVRRWKPNKCPCHIWKNYVPNVRLPQIFEQYFKSKIILVCYLFVTVDSSGLGIKRPSFTVAGFLARAIYLLEL